MEQLGVLGGLITLRSEVQKALLAKPESPPPAIIL